LGDGAGSQVEDRVLASQDRFRRANDELEARYVELLATGAVPFICECADTRCTRVVSLTLDEYAEVRSHPNRFVVVPGHRLSPLERVVEDRAGYAIAEKPATGDGAPPASHA
jgi:hypothetical protein